MKSILFFGLLAATNKALEKGMLNFVWRQITSMPKSCVLNAVYMLTVTYMATERKFEAIFDKLNVGSVLQQ
jgi:hypothetical protein